MADAFRAALERRPARPIVRRASYEPLAAALNPIDRRAR